MSAIDNYFDKIFIINLDESTDRWENVVAELKKVDIQNYERVPGIRLKSLDGIPPSHYRNLVSQHSVHEYYKIGICGGNMAHIKCVKLAKERNYNNVLILEDDIGIREDIHIIFEKVIEQLKNINWDMLYFGVGNHSKSGIIPVTENLVRGRNLLACHAYALKKTLYDEIINNGLGYGAELDNYYRFCIQPRFNCLSTKPRLMWQKDGHSVVLQRHSNVMKATKDK